jgi:hypothetical protein
MTFFSKLQLPQSAIASSKASVTAEEVREGIKFEVKTATEFILFFLSLIILVATYFQWPILLLIPSLAAFIGWQLVLLRSSAVRHLRLWIMVTYGIWICCFSPTLISHQIFFILIACNCMHCIGFHPTPRLFLHVPLSSPAVQTGLAMTGLSFTGYWLAPTESAGIQCVASGFGFCMLVITAAFMAETSIVYFRNSKRLLVIHSPWKDVFMSIRAVVTFRLHTGMRLSSFAFLLDAEESSEVITHELLTEWFDEERGHAVWDFIVDWKQDRLGKEVSDYDILPRNPPARISNDAPLRSPLLRGY